jgi:hypothetical protein
MSLVFQNIDPPPLLGGGGGGRTHSPGGEGVGGQSLPAPSDHTDSHTLDTYIWGGAGGGGL